VEDIDGLAGHARAAVAAGQWVTVGLQVTGPVGGAAALGAWLLRRYPEVVVARSGPLGERGS
jgi:hypothetical protein